MQENSNHGVSRRRLLTGSMSGLAMAGLPEWFAKEAVAQEAQAGPSTRRVQSERVDFASWTVSFISSQRTPRTRRRHMYPFLCILGVLCGERSTVIIEILLGAHAAANNE